MTNIKPWGLVKKNNNKDLTFSCYRSPAHSGWWSVNKVISPAMVNLIFYQVPFFGTYNNYFGKVHRSYNKKRHANRICLWFLSYLVDLIWKALFQNQCAYFHIHVGHPMASKQPTAMIEGQMDHFSKCRSILKNSPFSSKTIHISWITVANDM